MKTVYHFTIVSVLQLILTSHSVKNNVCKTIQDYYTIENNPNCEYDVAADPDADLMTVIKFYGYTAETHKVTTLDGYILTFFRIQNQMTSKKGPVFLSPGLLANGASFFGLRKDSLAFVLVDAGYDVWLGSYRGTEYSEEHVNLTVFDEQYWDYSLDEIALYDTPAQLDYVSQATGNKGDIVYIGYSTGTSFALIYSSTLPEQANRILKLLILLAPTAQVSHNKCLIFQFLKGRYRPLLKTLMDNHLMRLASHSTIQKSLTRLICFQSPVIMQGCLDFFKITLIGPQTQMETNKIPVFFNQIPAGSSFKMIAHLGDFALGNFTRYDYGLQNFEKYGSYTPPPYELKRIDVPVFLSYAVNDWGITPKDSLILYHTLPQKVRYGKYEIRVPNFNHVDFIYGKNAKSIVYDVILRVLDGMK